MPEYTPKLNLPKPLGNEAVSRANHNALVDAIDQAAASQAQVDQPFYLQSVTYDGTNDRLVLTIGSGRANFGGTLVIKTEDTTYYINAPAPNTTYYLFLRSDGGFTHKTVAAEAAGEALLWQVQTGATVSTITATDLRGQLPGAAARAVQDNLDAHAGAPDPHPQYALDSDLSAHKSAATLDHPDSSVTDAKIGNRTISDANAPTSDTGTLTTLLGWLANMIRAITGQANWRTAPAASLATIWGKFHQSTGHKHTGGANDAPPVPLSGIDSAAKTSAGGSEANRLAVTDANGGVGRANTLKDGGGAYRAATSPGGTTANAVAVTDAGGAVGRANALKDAGGNYRTAGTAGGTEATSIPVTDANGAVGRANALRDGGGAYRTADDLIEESLRVEAVAPVPGEEPEQKMGAFGPVVSFADAATKSVTFNIRWPFAQATARLNLRLAASTANSGGFRVRVRYRINGGTEQSGDYTITPGASTSLYDWTQQVIGSGLTAGALISMTISRLGADANDTHPGEMHVYHARLVR